MQGVIVKGIAGFYYVYAEQRGIYECKAKGVFRNQKRKPLVGDKVIVEELSAEPKLGNITEILPRTNELIRPAVANVDQMLIVFAAADPKPNLNLLDRFLVIMRMNQIPTIIAFNKDDLISEEERERLQHIYEHSGCEVMFISVKMNHGLEELRSHLSGKLTVLSGPSGVGKSSLLNQVCNEERMETGTISEKIKRGKHTTRHSELIRVNEETFLMDTPGFTSLYLDGITKEELKDYYPEFWDYEGQCRFLGCAHLQEPDCGVKQAIRQGLISKERYSNYEELYIELKNQRSW